MPAPAPASRARGVLFDVDDTLVDLKSAQLATFAETIARQAELTGAALPDQDRMDAAALHFAADVNGHYQRYVDGELDFLGQRFARARDALQMLGITAEPDHQVWGAQGYEQSLRERWALFEDVPELLSVLEGRGIPWGVVTNHTEAYQRGKLAAVGLDRVQVVIGTDTAGAPKPEAAPFLAGCRGLGVDPSEVLYVGDNPEKDGRGARDAGLISLLVLRPGTVSPAVGGGDGGTSSATVPEGVWVVEGMAQVARFVTAAGPLL